MRCRNGETRDDVSMALLLLRSEAACLVTQLKQIHDPAQPHGGNEARCLPRERFSPLWHDSRWGWWLLVGYLTATALFAALPSLQDIRLGARSLLLYVVIGALVWWAHANT